MELVGFVIFAAVLAFTWVNLLTPPGEVFDFIPGLTHRLGFPEMLQKVLHDCTKCVSGQIALWGYPIIWYSDYSVSTHIVVVIFAIFVAYVIDRIAGTQAN